MRVRVEVAKAAARTALKDGHTPRSATALLVDRGMSRRAAGRYVGAVLLDLYRDAQAEPLESHRERIALVLEEHRRLALGRTKKEWSGTAHVEAPNPDIKAANQAIWLIAQIRGVADPRLPRTPQDGEPDPERKALPSPQRDRDGG